MKHNLLGTVIATSIAASATVLPFTYAYASPAKSPVVKKTAKPVVKQSAKLVVKTPIKPPVKPVVKPEPVLLGGMNENPRWLNANEMIVSHKTDEAQTDYLLNVTTKKFEPVLSGISNASELVVSPDGKQAAFIDESGALFVVNLTTKQVKQINSDDKPKASLVWSLSGDNLYYIEADKGVVIASASLTDGKVTKVVDDQMDFKTDLHLSADGKTLLYTVDKSGKVDAAAPAEDDPKMLEQQVKVDTTGTESQLFSFDLTQKGAKAVQVTKDKENKVHANFLPDGSILYLSVDSTKESNNTAVKLISQDGKTSKDIIADMDIIQPLVTNDGKLILLVNTGTGKAVYTVENGTKKKLADLSANAEQLSISPDGKNIAVVSSTETGSKISVVSGSKLIDITK
ncbi:hypothetical protein [Aneurinibacillus terranovensis]|uniref:hypothetical protein n=1 Tax=Aneurinibacillus terranovensis TaxID=278991 RepID=UPI0003F8E114|nr:hypothetical protein [Aneurinibacillus terranovensis]